MQSAASYRPPPGGAAWLGGREGALLYLAWGNRRYGRTPLPPERVADWIYIVPRTGKPTVVVNGRRIVLDPAHFLILSPGCSTGYEDKPDGRCFIQTWVWGDPPHFGLLRPASGGFLLLKLSKGQAHELCGLHAACRREVQHPDACTKEAVASLRLQIDIVLARGPQGRAAAPAPDHRLALALRWLREHPAEHAPSRGLCDYLQVSPAALRRLFVNSLGHGPREEALRIRLEAARRLIGKEGWSVKATAYHLGYGHPNDLSRLLARSGPRA